MSDRAEEFLDYWESEYVSAVPHAEKRREAERLVANCLEDARRAGVNQQDLEDAAESDLISYMLEALEAAAFRAIEAAASKDDQS